MEDLRALARSPDEIRRTIRCIQETLTPENSSLALCGKCRYNDAIRELCDKTCYPYCQCRFPENPAWKEMFIFYSPDNKAHKYSYFREIMENLGKTMEALMDRWFESRWYNFRTRWLINKALTNILDYQCDLIRFSIETNMRGRNVSHFGSEATFGYAEPPRNV